jgi:ATP-dependent Clp protease ATP-binding subunit ClpX
MRALSRARPAQKTRRLLTPRQIYEFLDGSIIGQDEAKRAVAIAAYGHLKRCSLPPSEKRLFRKSNVLLIGPTGSGKTLLGRKLAECLDLPLSIVDATEYTEAGYYGKDIELMVAELLHRANYSIEEAQRGIIFIDEIDKLARRSQSYKTGGGTRDIGGEGVQQALLKLLEGRELMVPLQLQHNALKQDLVQVDTADILFIAAGTFSDLFDYRAPRAIGFGDAGEAQKPGAPSRAVDTEELIAYGMLAELLGRLPVRVELSALTETDLVEVLREPADSLVREYSELLLLDGVRVHFADEALVAIAKAALSLRCGARGLRSLMEAVCRDLLFEAPERRGQELTIDRDYVLCRLQRVTRAAVRMSASEPAAGRGGA